MADQLQTYANHRRYFPMWHFFAFPVLLINVFVVAVFFARNPGLGNGWNVVVAVALIVGLFASRYMPLRTQDRIICFEERTRLERLLPPELRRRIPELRSRQLIALRFASDDETPELTRRVLAGDLKTPSDIKHAISSWRADHMRV